MEKELDLLLSKILKYHLTNKNKDFRWFELFGKINNLTYHLPNMKNDYEKDCELSSVMSFIEQQFHIPMLKINLISWLKETNYNNLIFSQLSELRSI